MLTLPILLSCWTMAAACALIMVLALWRRRFVLVLISYAAIGFFGIAVPFKIALHALTALGMLFFTLAWPLWMLQGPGGFSIVHWVSPSFWGWMFDV